MTALHGEKDEEVALRDLNNNETSIPQEICSRTRPRWGARKIEAKSLYALAPMLLSSLTCFRRRCSRG